MGDYYPGKYLLVRRAAIKANFLYKLVQCLCRRSEVPCEYCFDLSVPQCIWVKVQSSFWEKSIWECPLWQLDMHLCSRLLYSLVWVDNFSAPKHHHPKPMLTAFGWTHGKLNLIEIMICMNTCIGDILCFVNSPFCLLPVELEGDTGMALFIVDMLCSFNILHTMKFRCSTFHFDSLWPGDVIWPDGLTAPSHYLHLRAFSEEMLKISWYEFENM